MEDDNFDLDKMKKIYNLYGELYEISKTVTREEHQWLFNVLMLNFEMHIDTTIDRFKNYLEEEEMKRNIPY